jgi:hypothetical protein
MMEFIVSTLACTKVVDAMAVVDNILVHRMADCFAMPL